MSKHFIVKIPLFSVIVLCIFDHIFQLKYCYFLVIVVMSWDLLLWFTPGAPVNMSLC